MNLSVNGPIESVSRLHALFVHFDLEDLFDDYVQGGLPVLMYQLVYEKILTARSKRDGTLAETRFGLSAKRTEFI